MVLTWHIQVCQSNRPAPEAKKRWGPALWLWKGLVALARATKRTKLKSKPSIALWNPAALERLANFFFWVRVRWCCALEYKKQKENRIAVLLSNYY